MIFFFSLNKLNNHGNYKNDKNLSNGKHVFFVSCLFLYDGTIRCKIVLIIAPGFNKSILRALCVIMLLIDLTVYFEMQCKILLMRLFFELFV